MRASPREIICIDDFRGIPWGELGKLTASFRMVSPTINHFILQFIAIVLLIPRTP